MNKNLIFNFFDRLFYKDIYYIYNMTIYHFLIIFSSVLGFTYNYGIFYSLSLSVPENIFELSGNSLLRNLLLILQLLILDFSFLLILMYEIKFFRLNWHKLIIIELILLIISFFIAPFRDILFFLSFNTIEIYMAYRIFIKYLSDNYNFTLFRYVFLGLSYIFLLKILIINPIRYILVYYFY